jgi:hypothetical protein
LLIFFSVGNNGYNFSVTEQQFYQQVFQVYDAMQANELQLVHYQNQTYSNYSSIN